MKKNTFESIISIPIVLAVFFALAGCVTAPERAAITPDVLSRVSGEIESGWAALWEDRFSSAEEHFKAALELNKQSAEGHRGLGLSLFARGAYREAADELLVFLERDPMSPYAVPTRDFIISEIPFDKAVWERIGRVNKMFIERHASPWIRREGMLVQRDIFRSLSPDPKRVRDLSKSLGNVTGWKLLGPFSNVSGSGYGKDFITEGDSGAVDFEAVYTGIDGRTISWFEPGRQDNAGYVSLTEYLGQPAYMTAYAYTEVEIEVAGEYYLIFDQSGAIRCWVDDELVLSDPAYSYGSDVHWIRHALDAGTHRFLVKVSNRERRSGFRLSLERADVDIFSNRSSPLYGKIFPSFDHLGFDPLIASLTADADAFPERPEPRFWLAYMLAVKGYGYESLRICDTAETTADDGGGALFSFARSRAYRALGKPIDERNSLVRYPNRPVLFAPSVEYLCREYIGQKRWDRLEKLLDEAEDVFGEDWFYGDIYRIWLTASRDGVEEAIGEMDRFRKDHPDSAELDLILLDADFGYKSFSTNLLFERIEKSGRPLLSLLRKMHMYMSWGNYYSAFPAALELKEHFPASEEIQTAYVRAGYHSGTITYNTLREEIADLFESFPYSRNLIELDLTRSQNAYYQIKRFQREGRESTEIRKNLDYETNRYKEALVRYLELEPGAFYYRRELRDLNNQPPFDTLVVMRDAFEAIADFEAEAVRYEDDAVIVLGEETHVSFGDGGSRSYIQDIIKVLSKTGVRNFSTYFLRYHPLFDDVEIHEAFVLKPDGSKLYPGRSGDRLSFSGLSEGDYIVVYYTRNSRGNGSLSKDFWGHASFSGYYPVYLKEFRIAYPDSIQPTVRYHNDEGKGLTETYRTFEQSMKEICITAERMPPIRIESGMPDLRDVITWVDVSTVSGWDEIADWYDDLSTGQRILTPRIRELAASLIEGKASSRERIESVYDFVSRTIEYEDVSFMYSAYIPQEAETVLEDGFGDCKDQCTLLLALLEAAGIQGYLALSAPDYRGEHFYLPSTRFSHVVVIVPEDEGDLILDPTTQFYTFPELPAPMTGTCILPIDPDHTHYKAAIRSIQPPEESRSTYYLVELDPSPDRSTVRGTALFAGYHAGFARSTQLSNIAFYNVQAFDSMLRELVPGFTLTGIEPRSHSTLETAPVVAFEGTIAGTFIRTGPDLYTLEIPWFVRLPDRLIDLTASEERTHGIDLSFADLASPSRQVTVVDIPDGFELFAMPENFEVEYRGITIRYRFEATYGKLICERSIRIPVLTLSAEELAGFDAVRDEIFAKERERIVFRVREGG